MPSGFFLSLCFTGELLRRPKGASFNSLSLPCLNGLFASGLFIAFVTRESTIDQFRNGTDYCFLLRRCDLGANPTLFGLAVRNVATSCIKSGQPASLCGAATSGFRTTTKARRSGRDCSSAQLAKGNLMLGKAWRYLFFQFLSCASCSVSVLPFLLPSWTEDEKSHTRIVRVSQEVSSTFLPEGDDHEDTT